MRLLTIFTVLFTAALWAGQSTTNTVAENNPPTEKFKTVTILTSAVCGDCKDRIEKGLNYSKGVVFAELDMDSKKVTVKYKTKVLDDNKVRQIIADLGYDADNVKRNSEAFEALPGCCKSPGHCSRD